jgi:ABC-2 type transport system permease protein
VRAYVALARTQIRASTTYRLNFALSMFSLMFQLFAMLAIWGVLLGSGTVLEGFDWAQMKAYLLVGFLSGVMVGQWADFGMAFRIHDGDVALDLTKPMVYQNARFATVCGGLGAELLLGLVVCAGVALFTGGIAVPTPAAAALFALSMLIVVPLKFLVVYLAALACFYTQNFLGIHWTRLAVVTLFSGALVPLAFLPDWLRAIAEVLPFAGLASTPGLIYIGQSTGADALRLIVVQAAWAVGLWVLGRVLFNRAVRQVTIHGG